MVANAAIYLPIPYFMNIPYKPFAALSAIFNVTDCNQWYTYAFADGVPEDEKRFWGNN
jgi:hypothetical protein